MLQLLLRRHCTQDVEGCFHGVEFDEHRLEFLGGDGLHIKLFQERLQPVCHFAQTHGTCQTGATLQGMQGTQQHRARLRALGVAAPLAQRSTQSGQQVAGLFLKNREQVGIDHIQRIDVIVFIVVDGHGAGHGSIQFLLCLQSLQYLRAGLFSASPILSSGSHWL